jgi:mannose-6-phosphate isomerase-like protein (cupin superfamily)
MVLLVGVLPATSGAQIGDKKALTANEAKPASTSAVVHAGEVNEASALQSGASEASPSLRENYSRPLFLYWDAATFKATLDHKPGTPIPFSGEGGRRNFEVHTFHRVKPGQVEYHTLSWDVVYILDGSATFVVGGAGLVNPKQIGPNEFTGSDIVGGPTRTVHLQKGDFYIVPTGVPHWYKEVQVSIDYIIIKIRDGSMARDPMDGKVGYCSETTGGTNVKECE